MAISLSSLTKSKADKPPRVLLYGPPGIGKTTMGSEFPNPVFLQIEEGTPMGVELDAFSDLKSFKQVMEALAALYTEAHDFKTLVVDSVTALERLIFAETCARGDEKGNPKNNIEDFGYGKGYVLATRIASEFIEGINALRRDRGMAIVLIAHSTVMRFDDPETVSYDRYEIALRTSDKPNADIRGLFERDMDAIFLLKQPVTVKSEEVGFNKDRAIASGGGTVLIHTVGKPAYTAKNRYNMPPTIRYDKGQGFAALAQYFPTFADDTKQEAA
ncbi:ATP-binding protein [Brucella sp. IR073]|uniref:ATP-binding protein n=1 Tax=unclassified Brucella TaxID=2632610 RepID=UPI003B9877DF